MAQITGNIQQIPNQLDIGSRPMWLKLLLKLYTGKILLHRVELLGLYFSYFRYFRKYHAVNTLLYT